MIFSALLVSSLFVSSPLALAGIQAQATRTDHQSRVQDLLIDKLRGVFSGLPESSPARVKVGLRLADLHAERARLQAKKKLEEACIGCADGQGDREQALRYYHHVLPGLTSDRLQTVLIQMGHLYEVMNQNTQAIEFYKKGIDGSQGFLKAEAEFSLAEIYFKQRDFQQAQIYYQQALTENSFKKKGLASFRLSWCRYNTGDVSGAVSGLEKMLRNPGLFSRNKENLSGVDEDFKAEVARDYTVFMAHSQLIGLEAIEKVFQLSPEQNRIGNVSFLAEELERLGRIRQSEQAWELIVKRTDQVRVRMEVLVNLARLDLRMNNEKDKLFSHFKRALVPLSQTKKNTTPGGKPSTQAQVDQRTFEELKRQLRSIVFKWNRSEEKNPSKELIMAYGAWFEVVSEDVEAFKLASQAATLARNFHKAWLWNGKAISLIQDSKELESLLIRRIEIAELAENSKWLMTAQNLYLEKSIEKTRLSEIRYQMAQVQYENKNYEMAANQFHKLALDPSVSDKWRLQSAELALDSLVLTKNDPAIEAWGKKFAKNLPDRKKHFLGLVGQSILSQSARFSSDPDKSWTILNRFDVSSANPEQVKTYHENRIILSRQLNKFYEMGESLQFFPGLDNLTDKERRFALENKVWLSETRLDFNGAYLAYRKLNTGDWLRLARLADLAEKPSERYYLQYLKNAQDSKLAFSICFKLIEKSRSLKGPYKSCVPHLQKKKEAFAGLIIDLYGKGKPTSLLLGQLKTYGLEKTWVASVVSRGLLLQRGEVQLKRLEKHQLKNRYLVSSIQRRLNLIHSFEKTISEATKTRDWLAQTLFLSYLRTQYIRFYENLMALPLPADMNDEERRESMTLLSQQATPYREKADQIQIKLDELWRDQDSQDWLYADFHKSTRSLQALLGPQIEKLKSVVERSSSDLLNLVYRQERKRNVSSVSLLKRTRQQIRKTPRDRKVLKKLVELETVRGYQPMIIYLKNRLEKLDQH